MSKKYLNKRLKVTNDHKFILLAVEINYKTLLLNRIMFSNSNHFLKI